MKHFPIFLKTTDRRIGIIGNKSDAVAKARLMGKSEAMVEIYADAPKAALATYLAQAGSDVIHQKRAFHASDITDTSRPPLLFVYLTDDDTELKNLFSQAHIPFCVIDNLAASAFTTPALVDRAPVTIAIGTEGLAPVLARRIKKELEERLPQSYGALAQVAGSLRTFVSQAVSPRQYRHFWARYFDDAHAQMTEEGAKAHAKALIAEFTSEQAAAPQPVWFVSAGPGSPDLLTMQARRLLHDADVILHDRLVPKDILELCRREGEIIEVGKTGFGPSWQQQDIHELMIAKARKGRRVVRLKSGDATIFSRLDEELAALHEAGLAFEIAPGITSAAAGAAAMGAAVTKRGRNKAYQIITGHDVSGYAEYEWREMATAFAEGALTAAAYMSVRAAPYMAGRLLMHGAPPHLQVTIAENISQAHEKWLVTTLGSLPKAMEEAAITGPAILYLGLAPHEARLPALDPILVRHEAYDVTEQA